MSSEPQIEDWQLLSQVSQAFRTLSEAFMDRVDMHRGQGFLLCVIAAQDGMTQSEIAEELAVQGATITNMLQRMEEAGLVTRRRDASDNRLVRVYLTDAGETCHSSIRERMGELEATIFAGLSPEDHATLRRLLGQLIQNMSVKS